MRIVYLLLLFLTLSFAKVLSLNGAFQSQVYSNNEAVFIDLKLGNEIYLYRHSLNILVNGENLNTFINFPSPSLRKNEEVYYRNLKLMIPNSLLDKYKQGRLEFTYQGCSEEGLCYQPQKISFDFEKENLIYKLNPSEKISSSFANSNSQESLIANFLAKDNVFIILLTFFGYGLLLSLTPCMLPMIPILSSLIVAKSGVRTSKKHSFLLSFIYVFFMSLAYAIAGVLASFLGASVQGLLQKPSILIIFSLIFVFFALTMFGAFRFELPLKFQNFIYKKSEKGKGIIGIAIMGFLSALIVGPCVAAPLAGALLYIAHTKDALLGGLALFIMSFGMGIPLLFIGFGLGFLKPGFWMQRVKIFFGFVMLAMAIWILSRLILENYTLMAFGILGVFFSVFMGLFEKAFDVLDKIKKSILILVFVYSLSIFLGGLFGAKDFFNPLNFNTLRQNSNLDYEFIDNLNSLKQSIQNSTKPVMLDFTASWCENCKLLEEFTFSDRRVQNILKNYKLIKVDVSENTEEQIKIMKEFGVFAPPVLIFFENAKEKTRITGFVNANEFLRQL